MISTLCSLGRSRLVLPAVLILCLAPTGASAQSYNFRNECNAPVVVQAVAVVRGVVRRDRPHLIKPGDATPAIPSIGDTVITVYDAKVPNRVLFQGALPMTARNLFFGITPDALPGRVQMEPRKPPPPPPGGP